MGNHYFDDNSSDFEEYSIQPFGWADALGLEEDNSAFESRDTFESDFYLEYCIVNAIGRPPVGSRFKLERIESDYNEYGSSVYERLLYIYRPQRKLHSEYLKKLGKLLNSKRWNSKCLKMFESEYQKFVDFKKRYPEDDYKF
ncbi:MAG: hypothetical protein ACM3O3_03560 [Syntrophothermus sp.]